MKIDWQGVRQVTESIDKSLVEGVRHGTESIDKSFVGFVGVFPYLGRGGDRVGVWCQGVPVPRSRCTGGDRGGYIKGKG